MHSLALAIGAKDSKSIRGPGGQQKVIDILRELVRVTGRLLVLDRDVTTTTHVKYLLAAIAPDHDVLHVRCTTPGQRNAFRYAFDCQEEKVAGRGKPLALARFEQDLRACIASFKAETVGTLRAKVMRHLRRVKIGIACASMSPRTTAAIRGAEGGEFLEGGLVERGRGDGTVPKGVVGGCLFGVFRRRLGVDPVAPRGEPLPAALESREGR